MEVKEVSQSVVCDVIDGDYGYGKERKDSLAESGYDYEDVQSEVNSKMRVFADIVCGGVKERIKNYFNERSIGNLLKCCTKYFLTVIQCEFTVHGKSMTASDIEYRDGYFVVRFGKNSVVHFHFDELPEWKFGIWWKFPKDTNNVDTIKGTLFAQLESEIDKFKPSASDICCEFEILRSDGGMLVDTLEIFEQLNNMLVNKYSCICNELYIETKSEKDAQSQYAKYLMKEASHDACVQFLDNLVLDYVYKNLLPSIKGAHICGNRNSVLDKYDILAPYKENKNLVTEPGIYYLLAYVDTVKGGNCIKEWDDFVESCEKIAKENKVYWDCPISTEICFTED